MLAQWCKNLIGPLCKSTTYALLMHCTFHSAILPDSMASQHEPRNGDIPRFCLAEIRVERQGKEPLPPTPGVNRAFAGKTESDLWHFQWQNWQWKFFRQKCLVTEGMLASDPTPHPAPACELSFLKNRSISPGIPCLQPGDVVLFKRMNIVKHWNMAAA